MLSSNVYIHHRGTSREKQTLFKLLFLPRIKRQSRCTLAFIVPFRRITASCFFVKAFQAVRNPKKWQTAFQHTAPLCACLLHFVRAGLMFHHNGKKRGLLYSCFRQAVSRCRLLSALIVVNHDKRVQRYPSILSSCYLSTLGIKLLLKKK